MNAKELRIGNIFLDDEGWISVLTGFAPHEHLTRCDTDEGCKLLIDYVDGSDKDLETESVGSSPIPLTPEVLEKCGFEYRNEVRGDGMLMDLNNPDWKKSFCLGKLWGRDGFTHLGTDRVDILYLHQLQNLFFAITGIELPYNP